MINVLLPAWGFSRKISAINCIEVAAILISLIGGVSTSVSISILLFKGLEMCLPFFEPPICFISAVIPYFLPLWAFVYNCEMLVLSRFLLKEWNTFVNGVSFTVNVFFSCCLMGWCVQGFILLSHLPNVVCLEDESCQLK